MNAPIQSPVHGSSASNTSMRPSPSSSIPSSTSVSSMSQFAAPPAQQPAQERPQSTDAFLRDFNLVAEAAKRAQMACLMRDMEGFGLS